MPFAALNPAGANIPALRFRMEAGRSRVELTCFQAEATLRRVKEQSVFKVFTGGFTPEENTITIFMEDFMGLPKTEDGLRDFENNLYAQCNAHKTEWNIPEADLTTLRGYVDDYDTKLAVSRTPDHRKSDIVAKNESKKALRHYLPLFQGKNMDFNNAITKPVRESLGLTIHDTVKTPVERPQSAPRGWV